MAKSPSPVGTTTSEITITRVLDAPRDLVWKAWTEPTEVMRWWGPKNFTAPSCRIDLRVGGTYLCCMRSPEGQDFWSTGRYLEITRPERIVCTDSFANSEGDVVPASHYGMVGDWPLELQVEVEFKAFRGKTRLTLRHTGMPTGNDRDLAMQGWNESLDKLAEALKQMKV